MTPLEQHIIETSRAFADRISSGDFDDAEPEDELRRGVTLLRQVILIAESKDQK